jgi:Metal binding domain of Ada
MEIKRRFSLRVPALRTGPFGGGLGLLVVAVGLLAIGLGWNGAAGSGGQIKGVTDLRAQLPWLISGGVLGLALVVFGAGLLVVHNARSDRARLEAKFEALIGAVSRGGAGPTTVLTPQSAAGLYVSGGTTYHRPDCRLVPSREDVSYVTVGEAAAQGLRACRVCKPAEAETLSR